MTFAFTFDNRSPHSESLAYFESKAAGEKDNYLPCLACDLFTHFAAALKQHRILVIEEKENNQRACSSTETQTLIFLTDNRTTAENCHNIKCLKDLLQNTTRTQDCRQVGTATFCQRQKTVLLRD